MKLLDGQRAIVTGGGSGIGRATARRMAAHGARVAILDLNQAAAAAVADEVGGVAFAVDVADGAALAETMRAAAEALGGLSLLFNNAGIGSMARLHDYPLDEWDRLIRVNLHGVFACLQAAGRHMLAAGRGAVVNISSVSARGSAGRAPYSTTKAAVIGLTATAGAEWAARGVRVNAVAPGYIDTGVFRQGVAQGTLSEETILARIPARRLAQPEEIGNAVSWLVSDQAAYMVGQTVYVDGGLSIMA